MSLRYLIDRARMRWRVNMAEQDPGSPPWWLAYLQGFAMGLCLLAICVSTVALVILLH